MHTFAIYTYIYIYSEEVHFEQITVIKAYFAYL